MAENDQTISSLFLMTANFSDTLQGNQQSYHIT